MSRILGPGEVPVAREALLNGELVAFPTETVYGLGADARNPAAIRKVFAAKGRPSSHPLIVHIGHLDQLGEWAEPGTPHLDTLAAAFWPGPLTVIVRHGGRVGDEVTGGQDTVGIRMPAHPLARELLGSDLALVGPSANRFGHVSPTAAEHVQAELGDRIPYILDGGRSAVGLESTIVDLSSGSPRILRPGMISGQAVAEVLAGSIGSGQVAGSPRTPGSMASHYAPRAQVRQVPSGQLDQLVAEGAATAVLAMKPAPSGYEGLWETLPATAADYAHGLYAALRRLDAGAGTILVQQPPQTDEWEAVRDRLDRASASREVKQ